MGLAGVTKVRPPQWTVNPGEPVTTEITGLDEMGAAVAWLEEARPALAAALHEHGAVFLRGLPIRSAPDFGVVRDTLMPTRTPYREKATPRSDLGDGVFSSTDLPASQVIRQHNENSYTLTFPGLLMFSCLVAPPEGGATPVTDCRKVLRSLPPAISVKMREAGWQLRRSYSEHISTDWQTAFGTADRADVERYCAQNAIACRWQADGHLRTSQLRPGIISHPATGDQVWFNHLAFWNEQALDEELREILIDEVGHDDLPFSTSYGDGSELSAAEFGEIDAAYQAATVRKRWQPGDLLLVDNILAAHGRDSFRGDRKVVVAMGQPVNVADCSPTVRPAASRSQEAR